jgi:hypothetical protein
MGEKKAYYHWFYAAFPVVYLYTHNIEEVFPQVILLPLIVSLAVGVLLWGVFRLILKHPQKSALLTFLVLFMIFTFGHFMNIFGYSQQARARLAAHLIYPWIIVFLGLIILVIRTRKSLNILTVFLNVCILSLFLFSVGRVVLFYVVPEKIPAPDHVLPDKLPAVDTLNKEELPDIYYFIFDRYAGSKTLEEYFHFDNSEFTSFLEGLGFYVASDSLCNYPSSHISISSSLNMQFLNHLVREGPVSRRVFYEMLQDFKVWRLLKSAGYKYFHFGSWWEPTKINRYADMNFRGAGTIDLNQDFVIKLLDSTILLGLFQTSVTAAKGRKAVLATFANLSEVPDMTGPKFVFAHILLPHPPYRFDASGAFLKTSVRIRRTSSENYINQLKFTNMKIMKLVSDILEKSSKPPIIIIQADEGPQIRIIPPKNLKSKYEEEGRERTIEKIRCQIFNAYHLPGVEDSVLYPHITPVNSFRLIFNLYFGTDFELLEDKTYMTVGEGKKLREFIEVKLR